MRRCLLRDLLVRAAVAAGAAVPPTDTDEVSLTVRNWERLRAALVRR